MREDSSYKSKGCEVVTVPKNTEIKEKKKKKTRKKSNGSKSKGHPRTARTSGHPSTPLTSGHPPTLLSTEDTDKPQGSTSAYNASSLCPLPALLRDLTRAKPCSRQDGDRSSGSGGRRTRRQPKDLTASPKAADKNSITGGAPLQGDVVELSAQAKESLRWEGVLEDPLAEEKRLEVYKANRRQRYLEATQTSFRQDRGDMVLPGLNQ